MTHTRQINKLPLSTCGDSSANLWRLLFYFTLLFRNAPNRKHGRSRFRFFLGMHYYFTSVDRIACFVLWQIFSSLIRSLHKNEHNPNYQEDEKNLYIAPNEYEGIKYKVLRTGYLSSSQRLSIVCGRNEASDWSKENLNLFFSSQHSFKTNFPLGFFFSWPVSSKCFLCFLHRKSEADFTPNSACCFCCQDRTPTTRISNSHALFLSSCSGLVKLYSSMQANPSAGLTQSDVTWGKHRGTAQSLSSSLSLAHSVSKCGSHFSSSASSSSAVEIIFGSSLPFLRQIYSLIFKNWMPFFSFEGITCAAATLNSLERNILFLFGILYWHCLRDRL